MTYRYQLYSFDELGSPLLYTLLALRGEVFIVEQKSAYLDLDGMDQQATHLCMFDDDTLAGYARLFAPGTKFEEASIGRIVVAPAYRGKGLGRDIMEYAMKIIHTNFPGAPIRIEAQHHLHKFYESLGFVIVSDVYMWDGIPHVKMVTRVAA